eukprot:TRINITY_DN3037_c0_g1_i1.p1 TRINITY_DN3037_c0_g1~~TRINITY_DN3037_c0_g1_i1.p1  ORF type:complete len:921 (+),score=88.66 TRINITY_DN3037_c0_g1_i1:57-2765(+)
MIVLPLLALGAAMGSYLPHLRGSTNPIRDVPDMKVDGGVLYAATRNTGLQILDVSDPSKVSYMGGLPLDALGVDVEGDIACVTTSGDGIVLVNVSDPRTPVEVSRTTTTDSCSRATIVGSFVFTSQPWSANVGIYDITNLSAPSFRRSVCSTVSAYYVDGAVLYCSSSVAQVTSVYNVTEPWNPVLISSFSGVTDTIQDMTVSNGVAYMAGVHKGLHMVSVADLDSMVLLSTVALGNMWGARVAADPLNNVVVSTRQVVYVVDAMDLTAPRIASQHSVSDADSPMSVVVSYPLIYLGTYRRGIDIVDYTTPTELSYAGGYFSSSYYTSVAVVGSVAYVADTVTGLVIYDVSDPSKPTVIGGYRKLESYYKHVAVANGVAYMLGQLTIDIIDVTSPETTSLLGYWTISTINSHNSGPGPVTYRIAVAGKMIYAAVDDRLVAVDATDPSAPRERGSLLISATAVSVAQNNIIYVLCNLGVAVVNVTDPDLLTIISSNGIINGLDLARDGDVIVSCGASNYAKMYSIANPTMPARLGSVPMNTYECALAGDLLAIAGYPLYTKPPYTTSIYLYNISDPRNAVELVNFDRSLNPQYLEAVQGKLFVVNGGLYIYDLPIATTIGCFAASPSFLNVTLYDTQQCTMSQCAKDCSNRGYAFAGVEDHSICRCGDNLNGSVKLLTADCDSPCPGDASEMCGGVDNILVQSLMETVNGNSQSYVGCFYKPFDWSTWPTAYKSAQSNTVEECTSICHWNGYTYAGLFRSDECVCGNKLPPLPSLSKYCGLPCTGNNGEECGGAQELRVFIVNGTIITTPLYDYRGCYNDSREHRSLPMLAYWAGDLTVELCLRECAHSQYTIAGLQFRSQCWCGHNLPPTRMPESQCHLPCSGNPTQFCGYAYRHSVYSIYI